MSQSGSFAPRAVVSIGLAVGLLLVGCGGNSSGSKYPDAATTGTGGTSGGTGGKAGTGGSGTVGTGGSAAGTGGAGTAASSNIGKACASAADCGPGITCLLPTDKLIFGAGGPANGYCTVPCTMATPCPTGSGCVDTGVSATAPAQPFCFQTCTPGTPASGAPLKCQGRDTDVACTPLNDGTDGGVSFSACLPTCSSDSDCPSGRKCDEYASVCVDTQSTGTPQGAHCDPNAATDACAGSCLPIGTGTAVVASFCSRRCVVGNLSACNWVPSTTSLTTGGVHGICLYSDQSSDVGDVGFCGQECDKASDCSDTSDPGVICNTTSLDSTLMSHGFCDWAGPTDAGTGN